MTTVEGAPEQSAQADPTVTNDADTLAEATLDFISGGNFKSATEKQQSTYEGLTKAQANAATEEKPAEVEQAKPAEVPAIEEAQAEPETEQASSEEAEADTDAEPETEKPAESEATAQKAAPSRFRFKDAEDKAIAQLALAKGISLLKAAELYSKLNEPEVKPEPEAETESAAPTVPTSPTVKTLEAEVAALEAKMEEFVDGIQTAESIKVTRDYANKVADLKLARRDAAQAAEADAVFEEQRQTILTDTVKTWPDMGNRNSAQYLVAARLADEAANPKHPDHKAACSQDAPRFFAKKAADLLKIKPATAQAQVAKPAVQKPTAKPGPASGTRQTQPPAASKPEAEQLAEKQAAILDLISGGRGNASTPTILIN